jgi:molybdate transport system regulatory protein
MPLIPSQSKTKSAETRLAIRLDLASGARIGPGKVKLLEEIARTGSIAAAARAMRMARPSAWSLVDEMNKAMGAPVVDAYKGGRQHGGARLTKIGRTLVAEYRAIEAAAAAASRNDFAKLEDYLRVR